MTKYACHVCRGTGSRYVEGIGTISGARCPNCDGVGMVSKRVVLCEACSGEGFKLPSADHCPSCKGTGYAEEEPGKIPWPNGT